MSRATTPRSKPLTLFPPVGDILPYDGSAIFYPDFLTLQEADRALIELVSTTPWEEQSLVLFGRRVLEPRLSAWVSDGVSYTYSRSTRLSTPWTPILATLKRRCEDIAGTRFNGVLANLYRDGRDHMGWHADDEPANGPEPIIASLSFGVTRRFDFKHNDSKETVSLHLTHGSLLVMSGLSQQKWKHRIAKTTTVNSQRVNLTFRSVDPSLEPGTHRTAQ